MQRLKLDKKENNFTFRINKLPYNAGIDPNNYLIDRIPDDNVKVIKEE